MHRTILTLCALILLGVLATFAVSWFCGWAVLYDLDSTVQQTWRNRIGEADESDFYHVDAAVMYALWVMHRSGAARVQFIAMRPDRAAVMNAPDVAPFELLWRDWGPSPASWGPVRRLHVDPPEVRLRREPYRTDMIFEARGWPMLATWCALDNGVEGGFHLGVATIPGTFATTERVLPYRPIWFGFAVNTLFYATIFGLLQLIVLWVRRRWRIAHRRCPACAYPVGAAPTCTECGATLPQPLKASSPPSTCDAHARPLRSQR